MPDRRRLAVLAASLTVAVLFVLPWSGPVARWAGDLDVLFLSFCMQRQVPPPPPTEIVGVTMDEASLEALGRYPWKRSVHARLIDRLTALGASVIALDTFFVRPTEPAEDAALAAAIRRSGRVVLSLGGHRGRVPQAPLFLEDAGHALGHTWVTREEGGMVFRIQLLGSTPSTGGGAGLPMPAFSLVAVQRHRHLDGSLPTFTERIVRMGDMVVPVEDDSRLVISFAGPAGTLPTVSYLDVLQGKVDRAAVAGKIALVYSTFDLNDQFETPVDRGRLMPGGEIHANAMQTMLTGRFLRHLDWPWRAALMLALAVAVAMAFSSGPRARHCLPPLAALGLLVGGGAYLAFRYGNLWLPLAQMVLFIPVAGMAVLALERLRMRRLFASFIPGAEVDSLLASDGHLDQGMRKVVASILFADIRGYTTLSETMDPRVMSEFLNEFHAVTAAAVRAHGGEILDYLGDASMVAFGAPRADPEHARAAVETALDIQEELARKRSEWSARGFPAPQVGIGICTGEVAYGLIGTDHRQYTVIGDTTNVAARIQGLSAQFDSPVVISDSTLQAAGPWFETQAMPPVPLKGKTETVHTHAVRGRSRP